MGITASSGPTMALSHLMCVDCLHTTMWIMTVVLMLFYINFADKVVSQSCLSERKTGCVKGFRMERKGEYILNN